MGDDRPAILRRIRPIRIEHCSLWKNDGQGEILVAAERIDFPIPSAT